MRTHEQRLKDATEIFPHGAASSLPNAEDRKVFAGLYSIMLISDTSKYIADAFRTHQDIRDINVRT